MVATADVNGTAAAASGSGGGGDGAAAAVEVVVDGLGSGEEVPPSAVSAPAASAAGGVDAS